MMTNPRDEVSFRRIINKPTRGIGPAAVERILSYASSTQGDLVAALQRAAEEGELSSRAQEGALHLSSLFARVRPMIETNDLVVAVTLLLEETGLLAYYQEQDRKAATFRVDNLQQLVNVIGEYEQSGEGLLLFLEQMALDRTTLGDADPSQEDGVTLITMHNTKGLEFDRVFIVGLEEEIFPGRNGSDKDDIEEERRTFYVALTRAKNELHLFSARRRRMWGHSSIQKPSRFLSEIEPSLIEMVGSPYDVESPQWSTPGWDKPKRSSWAVGGGNLIQQGFGPKAKTFTMKRVHEAEEGKPLFEVGQRVYNTNYGEGEVVSSRTGRDGQQVIDVHFFSGQKATYIAKFADIEKIGDV
jgi:DNA helicase-2/ATP-dependent DNA helicase PcrA